MLRVGGAGVRGRGGLGGTAAPRAAIGAAVVLVAFTGHMEHYVLCGLPRAGSRGAYGRGRVYAHRLNRYNRLFT